jgi:hydroxymethylglutaryl-CoA lyase
MSPPWSNALIRGEVSPHAVLPVVQALLAMGVDEVSLGETLGVATPQPIETLLDTLFAGGVLPQQLAIHCHNTNGRALDNVAMALSMGIRTVDTSAGAWGGARMPLVQQVI